MRTPGQRALILLALAAGLLAALHAGVRLSVLWVQYQSLTTGIVAGQLDQTWLAESCYPYRWQREARTRLARTLATPSIPPAASDLPAYAAYAMRLSPTDPTLETVAREGVRREPENALYHYLLARALLERAVTVTGGVTDLPQYTVRDRAVLDQAMEEVRAGTLLRYRSYRREWMQAQLTAMPPVRSYPALFASRQWLADADIDLAALHDVGRFNGYYLHLLLGEGRGDDARRFIFTNQTLAVQVAHDAPCGVRALTAAVELGRYSIGREAPICREAGLSTEAAELERRHGVLLGAVERWRQEWLANINPAGQRYQAYGAVMEGAILNSYPKTMPSLEELQPARQLEYTIVEQAVFGGQLLALGAALLGMLLGARSWERAAREEGIAVPAGALPPSAWKQVIDYGLVMPLALYFLLTNIPQIGGRSVSIVVGMGPFYISVLALWLWMRMVPERIIDRHLAQPTQWQRMFWHGAGQTFLHWKLGLFGVAVVCGPLVACLVAVVIPLWGFGMAIAAVIVAVFSLVSLFGMRAKMAQEDFPGHLARLRAMIPITAVTMLLLVASYSLLLLRERQLAQQAWMLPATGVTTTLGVSATERATLEAVREEVRKGALSVGYRWED